MSERIPSLDQPIDHYVRRENAERRVGESAQCACGESRAQALVVGSSPVTCRQCARRQKGRRTVDLHHFAGSANDPTTIPISANDHAADLTERQRDWPTETLENPNGDPLRRAAACVRGLRDTLIYLLDKAILWIAEMLEALSALQVAQHGPHWFRGTPLEKYSATEKGESK